MGKIISHFSLPEEFEEVFKSTYDKICETDEYKSISDMLKAGVNYEEIGEVCKAFAEKIGIDRYVLNMTVLVANADVCRQSFFDKGCDEQLFWDTVLDLKYKIVECHDQYGVWGIIPIGWFERIFKANLYQLGRLQFEEKPLKDGGKIIGMHIPACGPLKYEDVMDSYKKAYNFFDKTHGDMMAFTCFSYLVFEDYIGTVFKEGSNIYLFAKDFYILGTCYEENFHDAWRIFNMPFDGDTSKLPRDTSLQRAFIEYFDNGGKAGESRGVFFFDGENIHKENCEELRELL